MAVLGVAADHVELVVGELAGLVQHRQRDARLADVVHEAGHAGGAQALSLQADLAAQGHHERAHGHRMHVGVVVRGLQARETDEGRRIARHRVRDFLDEAAGLGRVHHPAHACLGEHRGHRLAGVAGQGGRMGQFLGHAGRPRSPWARLDGRSCRGRRGRRDLELRHVLKLLEIRLPPGLGLLGRDGLHPGGDVAPLGHVDPDLLDGRRVDAREIRRILKHETRAPEWMVHPGPAELVQVHAQGEVLYADSLEHGAEKGAGTGRSAGCESMLAFARARGACGKPFPFLQLLRILPFLRGKHCFLRSPVVSPMPAPAPSPAQKALQKLGLSRDIDLALHLPLRYEDETRITPCATCGMATRPRSRPRSRRAKCSCARAASWW